MKLRLQLIRSVDDLEVLDERIVETLDGIQCEEIADMPFVTRNHLRIPKLGNGYWRPAFSIVDEPPSEFSIVCRAARLNFDARNGIFFSTIRMLE